MVILGIDPGTASTGFGIIIKNLGKLEAKSYGIIRTSPQEELSKRLKRIYLEIKKIISDYRPDELVIEELFFNTNLKTALAVGQARGVLFLAAADSDLTPVEYSPLQVKQAVAGYGRASKDQIQFMVKSLLNLSEAPKPDDAADALALAICHAHSRGFNEKIKEDCREVSTSEKRRFPVV
ncbi:MAG TPA: crossover junction endodeoxyribonuclease RuvC [Candidatus Subteraquimicrobiales bacterium]